MLTTAEAFEKFRKWLELSETESQDAAKRHTEVRDCIRAEFDIKNDFLSGSYRRHTKTKPLKDVDVMFVMGEKEKHRRSKPPIETLQAFEKCLKKQYTDVAIGRRSVRKGVPESARRRRAGAYGNWIFRGFRGGGWRDFRVLSRILGPREPTGSGSTEMLDLS